MKYERFEQLPVWQAAITLAENAYSMTENRAFARLWELKDQLRRVALSVSNNIAEGFERGTTSELLAFLYIARGSAGEVRSMLLFCQRLLEKGIILLSAGNGLTRGVAPAAAGESEISDLKSQISDLISLAESCSRQIRGWADHLQNTDIQGQRRLNDKSRKNWQGQKSIDAFMKKLQDIRDAAEKNSKVFSKPESPGPEMNGRDV
ncbi:MAG: four helix bundle protein [Planctomycetes bacterium]|nr:four helix bundle protein [Planctomycetota bacterium]